MHIFRPCQKRPKLKKKSEESEEICQKHLQKFEKDPIKIVSKSYIIVIVSQTGRQTDVLRGRTFWFCYGNLSLPINMVNPVKYTSQGSFQPHSTPSYPNPNLAKQDRTYCLTHYVPSGCPDRETNGRAG